MNEPKFLLDTNVFIQSQNVDYPFDFCPGYWDLLEKGFKEGLLISHEKVLPELTKKEDQVKKWANALNEFNNSFFAEITSEEFDIYNQLCSWAKNNDHYTNKAKGVFCDNTKADIWLCSKGMAQNIEVVTQEVACSNRITSIKIPDVCKVFNIECCNKYEMLRKLNARFELIKDHKF